MRKIISIILLLCLLASAFTMVVSANEPNLFDANSKATGNYWEDDSQYEPNCIFEDFLDMDDKFDTRWVAIAGEDPAVLSIDIGSVKTFNRLRVVEARNRITNWTVEVSKDGSAWTKIKEGVGLENSVPDYDIDGVKEQYYSNIDFDTVEAQYIKLSFKTDEPDTLAVSLWRAELYNIGNVSLAAAIVEETPAVVAAVEEVIPAPVQEQVSDVTSVPQTGDMNIMIYIGIAGLCVGMFIITSVKNKVKSL